MPLIKGDGPLILFQSPERADLRFAENMLQKRASNAAAVQNGFHKKLSDFLALHLNKALDRAVVIHPKLLKAGRVFSDFLRHLKV